ncbi:MAG TPA: amidase family protein [Bellilinea sp.]|nr:amidase family protein [Bellilinea sp.]
MELCDQPAHELSKKLRAREVSAEEITKSFLQRIEQVDGRPGTLDAVPEEANKAKVHSFISLDAAGALEKARQVDADIAAEKEPGLLAGIPYTAKDIFCVKDTYSTAASRMLANFKAPYSATIVERLDAAGAIRLGKVNLDEYTYGSSNESSAFQPSPRNPWNLDAVPGGSSGGSATSVAASEAALSIGTDTAGSIRQPASFCGIVGLKPTYGRVSRYGLIAFGSSLDCPGPMAKDVTDTAMMLQVMAGADPRDDTASLHPVDDYLAEIDGGVKGMRIGLSPDYFRVTMPGADGNYLEKPLPTEIEASVRHAADVLRSLGAEIVEDVPMPNTKYAIPAYFVISRVEAASNLHRYDGVKYGYRTKQRIDNLTDLYRKTRGEGFGNQPKLRILMGMYVSAAQFSEQYYQRALKVRTLIRRDFEQAFDAQGPYRLDALLTPTTPSTAFGMGAVYGDSVMMQYSDQLAVPANHAGIPGLSLPGGLDAAGMPIGIQLLGPDFSEAKLFRIGRAFEVGTAGEDWRKIQPRVLRAG